MSHSIPNVVCLVNVFSLTGFKWEETTMLIVVIYVILALTLAIPLVGARLLARGGA